MFVRSIAFRQLLTRIARIITNCSETSSGSNSWPIREIRVTPFVSRISSISRFLLPSRLDLGLWTLDFRWKIGDWALDCWCGRGLSRFVVLCRALSCRKFLWEHLERVAAHQQWPSFRIAAFCFLNFCFQNDHLRQPLHYLRQPSGSPKTFLSRLQI